MSNTMSIEMCAKYPVEKNSKTRFEFKDFSKRSFQDPSLLLALADDDSAGGVVIMD
jgi:hypothetical protein